jgi:hypothetical protein
MQKGNKFNYIATEPRQANRDSDSELPLLASSLFNSMESIETGCVEGTTIDRIEGIETSDNIEVHERKWQQLYIR